MITKLCDDNPRWDTVSCVEFFRESRAVFPGTRRRIRRVRHARRRGLKHQNNCAKIGPAILRRRRLRSMIDQHASWTLLGAREIAIACSAPEVRSEADRCGQAAHLPP